MFVSVWVCSRVLCSEENIYFTFGTLNGVSFFFFCLTMPFCITNILIIKFCCLEKELKRLNNKLQFLEIIVSTSTQFLTTICILRKNETFRFLWNAWNACSCNNARAYSAWENVYNENMEIFHGKFYVPTISYVVAFFATVYQTSSTLFFFFFFFLLLFVVHKMHNPHNR